MHIYIRYSNIFPSGVSSLRLNHLSILVFSPKSLSSHEFVPGVFLFYYPRNVVTNSHVVKFFLLTKESY